MFFFGRFLFIADISRILHNVFYALHLCAHFLQLLPGGNQGVGRSRKGVEKALKRHNHPDSKFTFDSQIDTEQKDGGAGQGGNKAGYHTQCLVELGIADLLCVDAGLITRPLFEKSIFSAARLNCLNHLDSGHSCASQLARVAHLHPRDIDPLFGNAV